LSSLGNFSRPRMMSGVTGFTISTVVGSIHSHRMLPGGTVVDSGILGTVVVSSSGQEHAELYGDMQREALEDKTDAYLVEQGAPSGECSTPLQHNIDVEDYTNNNNSMDDGGESRVDHQYRRIHVVIVGGRRDDGLSASHSGDMY
jgi:hypothetical protein